jgi:hypothetical protein
MVPPYQRAHYVNQMDMGPVTSYVTDYNRLSVF